MLFYIFLLDKKGREVRAALLLIHEPFNHIYNLQVNLFPASDCGVEIIIEE